MAESRITITSNDIKTINNSSIIGMRDTHIRVDGSVEVGHCIGFTVREVTDEAISDLGGVYVVGLSLACCIVGAVRHQRVDKTVSTRP